MRGTRNTVRTRRPIPDVLIVTLIAVLLSSSCATRKAAVTSGVSEKQAHEASDMLSEQTRALEQLRRAIEEQIATAERRRLEVQSELRSAPPYFYKRFELYPSGTTELQIALKKTAVALKPYEATVSVPTARFTTRYHTSRPACTQDSDFIRDMGTQRDTYVYESGEWNLLYSLFEVQQTSVLRGDTWAEVTGAAERIAQDRPSSFFGRIGAFFRNMF